MSIKDLMYGEKGVTQRDETMRYRLERGFAYTRAGKILPPIPQFNALYLYSQAAGNVPKNFRVTMTSTRVRWPIPPIPSESTGS